MMDPKFRRRLAGLEIHAQRLLNTPQKGDWLSTVRGQGLEFRDLREYVPGDDVRRLDWKATARSGRPQLRRYDEDRQQEIWFAFDLSASMTGPRRELALEVLALLAWAAVRKGDRFGLVGFTDRIELTRRPARGETQLWALLEDLLTEVPVSKGTDLGPLWRHFLRSGGHRSTLIVLGDFQSNPQAELLRTLTQRHDLLALQVYEVRTLAANLGLSPWTDSETGETSWIDLGSPLVRQALAQAEASEREALQRELRKAGAWCQALPAGAAYLPLLLEFFQRRREVLGA